MHDPVKTEKKVEYLELIYDLIFVFVIGRNNLLLHNIDGGFISGGAFLAYLVSTLAVIQIWNFTTYYINVFGRNGVREHISLFVNMFLMYFIAEGIGSEWEKLYVQYHAAWALILLNIGIQYLLELRNHRSKAVSAQKRRMALPLFAEAAAVVVSIFTFTLAGADLSWLAILIGIGVSMLAGIRSNEIKVDFAHLTERAMLYVVFTFGEMIISLSGYFDGELSFNSLYFSVMGFLIVVSLFLSYETLYDRIVDREQSSNGLMYILIHVLLIFSLNNITVALEFMREDEIAIMPKMLFLIGSFLMYYFCIFMLGRWAKKRCAVRKGMIITVILSSAAFAALMLILREYMMINILLTVLYGFGIFIILHFLGKSAARTQFRGAEPALPISRSQINKRKRSSPRPKNSPQKTKHKSFAQGGKLPHPCSQC